MSDTRPKRRWYQYRLRTLLVFMALVGLAVRLIADPALKARRQDNAAEAIRASGGACATCQGKAMFPAWMPKWVHDCFAPNLPLSVSHVFLQQRAGNEQLAVLVDLPDVVFLKIDDCRVTDAGLAKLRGLTNLRGVAIANTRITDAGLDALKPLKKLNYLYLDGTAMTAGAVERFWRAKRTCEISGPQFPSHKPIVRNHSADVSADASNDN